MKFGFNQYHALTPKKVVQIADAITGACIFAGSLTALNGVPAVGTALFIAGFVAKFLSGFFGVDNNTATTSETTTTAN